jgi:hypothetical protein
MFDAKLKELKDNIITTTYGYGGVYPAPQIAGSVHHHYGMGDMDYPNPYPGQQPLFPVAADCKTDGYKPKTLEQQQYEEDMAFYNRDY